MPSTLHEVLVTLFHNDPNLAPGLLARTFGVELPDHTSTCLEDAALNQLAPTEYRADAVVVLRRHRPVHAIIVEVQLGRDPDKRYSWPVYLATLRARLRCPVSLLVLTPHTSVAEWARQPMTVGPGTIARAMVIGPDAVPRVDTVDEARASPELAVLSVLAHGQERGAEAMAVAAFRAVADLDGDRARLYCDLILSALGDAARHELEELMKTKYEYQSEFAKKYFFAGREEGREEGLEEGLEEGRAAGVREIVLRLLRRRGVELDLAASDRLAAADLECLERIAEDLVSPGDAGAVVPRIRVHLGLEDSPDAK